MRRFIGEHMLVVGLIDIVCHVIYVLIGAMMLINGCIVYVFGTERKKMGPMTKIISDQLVDGCTA